MSDVADRFDWDDWTPEQFRDHYATGNVATPGPLGELYIAALWAHVEALEKRAIREGWRITAAGHESGEGYVIGVLPTCESESWIVGADGKGWPSQDNMDDAMDAVEKVLAAAEAGETDGGTK